MLKEVMHIGLTVSDIDKSIEFYRDVLGLSFKGEILMAGKETDILFGKKNSRARVAYLNGNEDITAPPVELIQFTDLDTEKQNRSLYRTSISEICFRVDNIDEVYGKLIEKGVKCISEPQYFDFTEYGFGKSKAIYFKDPDGIILELMENID